MTTLVHGKTRSELLHYIAAINQFPLLLLPLGSQHRNGLCYQGAMWGVEDAYGFWDVLCGAGGRTGTIAARWNKYSRPHATIETRCAMRDALVKSLLDDMEAGGILYG